MPYELFSNDTVQFGVDVMENSRKGCIFALLLLLSLKTGFFLEFLVCCECCSLYMIVVWLVEKEDKIV